MNTTLPFTIPENASSHINCPVFTDEVKIINEQFSFWIGGILVCAITLPGFVLNIRTVYVLSTESAMKHIFNLLFLVLIMFDNACLCFIMFETIATNLGFHTEIHDILYPKFTLPLTAISLTASIFMTVVIAHERYGAIQYPIRHRQSQISAKSRRILLTKYISIVLVCALVVNIPKFFEAEVFWQCSQKNSTTILLHKYINESTNR